MKFLKIDKTKIAIISAFLSAVLFGLCVPFSKLLSTRVPAFTMGGLLYLGAGVGLLFSILIKKGKAEISLSKKELPYICAMVLLDIAAVIFLMLGISKTYAANVSLLGNFELVATACIAFLVFCEKVSKRLFLSIILITIASVILSFEGSKSFVFNTGSLFVLLSCVCWGFENNCTKMLSSKDTRQITVIKGLFCGLGGILIAFLAGENIFQLELLPVVLTMLLGLFSYGISVSLYIFAQRFLGAAKTGACYSIAPFIGVLFSLLFLGERPLMWFYIALLIMVIAVGLVICDTHNS